MKRKIVRIDEDKCDGCGLCVTACAEGAIELIDGKAKLVSETYCDGLGACLGDCPQEAITIEEREAAGFDEAAVAAHLNSIGHDLPRDGSGQAHNGHDHVVGGHSSADHAAHSPGHAVPGNFSPPAGGCPGSALRTFDGPPPFDIPEGGGPGPSVAPGSVQSALGHWPIQIMLVPPHAPFLRGADLLVCADCVPFAVPDFHQRYLAGRSVLVGCPKLDDIGHYQEKLRHVVAQARPSSVTVLKMEVPCCNGIAQATLRAIALEAPDTPTEVHTIGIRGGIHAESFKLDQIAN